MNSGLSAGLAEIEYLLSWRQARTMGITVVISIFFCGWIAMLLGPLAPYLVAHGFMFWGMQRAGSAIGREALGKTWDYQCLGSANPLAWLLSRYVAETLLSWLGASVALGIFILFVAVNSSFDFARHIAVTVMPMIAAHAIAFALGALVHLPPVAGKSSRWGIMVLAIAAWYALARVTFGDFLTLMLFNTPPLANSDASVELHRWWGLFPLSTGAYMVLWALSISACAFAYGAWNVGAAFGRPEKIPCGIVFAALAIPLFIAGWVFAPSAFYGLPYLADFLHRFDVESLRPFGPAMSGWLVLAYLVFAFGRGRIGPQVVILVGFVLLLAWLALFADAKNRDILLSAFFVAYTLRDASIIRLFRVARKPVWVAFLICALLRWPTENIISSAWPEALMVLFPHDVPGVGWIDLLWPLLLAAGFFLAALRVGRSEGATVTDQD